MDASLEYGSPDPAGRMKPSNPSMADDAYWMRQALAAAEAAGQRGEVPVGAVVVRRGELIATGGNSPIGDQDPTAHAEIDALRTAARKLGNYRLDECELFVTLEPCAMCAGAMLHARIKRVVFGATDPRTGAAGSVVDLFSQPLLNHQTQCVGGVLAEECGALLRGFFQSRRGNPSPLREDALRTPEAAFEKIPDFPWKPRYVNDLPGLAGLRLHYIDEGGRQWPNKSPGRTWLCLHGNPTWSYLYRHMIPVFAGAVDRVVAPDMPGFGKSDKPKRESAHRFSWHRQVLLELIERLDLENIVLVVHDWGALLGLTLPLAAPRRFSGLLIMNAVPEISEPPTDPRSEVRRAVKPRLESDIAGVMMRGTPGLSAEEYAAYQAPFPDKGHCSAIRALSQMVEETEREERSTFMNAAREFWRHQWRGQSLMVIGARDSEPNLSAMGALRRDIHGCPEPWMLEHAGHQVPEHGRLIAERALTYFTK